MALLLIVQQQTTNKWEKSSNKVDNFEETFVKMTELYFETFFGLISTS